MRRVVLAVLSLSTATCFLPAEERAELDREVGMVSADGIAIRVENGLAGVRSFDGSRLELWAQAPALRVHVDSPIGEQRELTIDVLNCMMTAALSLDGGPSVAPTPLPERAAACRFTQLVSGPGVVDIFPTSADAERPFVFAVLSDVQSAIDRVQDIFERMNEDPELAFVVSTGDLVDRGTRSELERFQHELATLEIPFFSTVGNHEMGAPARHWHELFGPFNVHFAYSGVAFSLVDSGNATIDPEMYERLDGWLGESRTAPHMMLTHVPPLDPSRSARRRLPQPQGSRQVPHQDRPGQGRRALLGTYPQLLRVLGRRRAHVYFGRRWRDRREVGRYRTALPARAGRPQVGHPRRGHRAHRLRDRRLAG